MYPVYDIINYGGRSRRYVSRCTLRPRRVFTYLIQHYTPPENVFFKSCIIIIRIIVQSPPNDDICPIRPCTRTMFAVSLGIKRNIHSSLPSLRLTRFFLALNYVRYFIILFFTVDKVTWKNARTVFAENICIFVNGICTTARQDVY